MVSARIPPGDSLGGLPVRHAGVIRLPVEAGDILAKVYAALTEKGYNPVNQIVGYIMSGDPTYITSYKNARSLIMRVERDELVEELLTEYIRNNRWKK